MNMTFSFDPTDATESERPPLIPEGEYEIKIRGAIAKTSKKKPDGKGGNPMLELTITVYTDAGERTVWDYIVNPHSLFKLKAVCKACGLPFDGELDEDLLVGKVLRAVITIREGTDGYSDKNEVAKYLAPTTSSDTVTATGAGKGKADKPAPITDEAVPF